MATTLTPILSAFWDDPKSWSLETYTGHNGYKALDKALAMEPAAIIAASKTPRCAAAAAPAFRPA